VAYPKGSPAPLSHEGGVVIWTLADLAASVSREFKVIVEVDGTANPIGANAAVASCEEEGEQATPAVLPAGDGTHEPGLVITGTAESGVVGTLRAQQVSEGRRPLRIQRPSGAQVAARLGLSTLLTYTVLVTNTNATHTMSSVAVSVTLPRGVALVEAAPLGYSGTLTLTWSLASLGPGEAWQGQVVVRVIHGVGEMLLEASSAEQSSLQAAIAPPSGLVFYRNWYLPIIVRNN
jgi:hypothetical protein